MSRPELKKFEDGKQISLEDFRYNVAKVYDSLTNTYGDPATGFTNTGNYGTGIHADQLADEALDADRHAPDILSRKGGFATGLSIDKVNGIKLSDVYKRVMKSKGGVFYPQIHTQEVSHGETFISTVSTNGSLAAPAWPAFLGPKAPAQMCGGWIGAANFAYGKDDQTLTNTITVTLPDAFDFRKDLVQIDPFYSINATLTGSQQAGVGVDQGYVKYYSGIYEDDQDVDCRYFPGREKYRDYAFGGGGAWAGHTFQIPEDSLSDVTSEGIDPFMQGSKLRLTTDIVLLNEAADGDGTDRARCYSFKGVRYDTDPVVGVANQFTINTTLIGNNLDYDPVTGFGIVLPVTYIGFSNRPVVRLDITATYKITALRFRKVF